MGGNDQIILKEKKLFSFTLVLLPTSPSAFSVPPPHAILSLFPPLPCLTCWLTPPPSLLLFPLSGWYVPRTKSRDGGRERESKKKQRRGREQEVRGKKGRGCTCERAVFFPSTCTVLCVVLLHSGILLKALN